MLKYKFKVQEILWYELVNILILFDILCLCYFIQYFVITIREMLLDIAVELLCQI